MDNIDTILAQFLNGEPLHDAFVIGLLFTIFIIFYNTFFSAMFSIFNRK